MEKRSRYISWYKRGIIATLILIIALIAVGVFWPAALPFSFRSLSLSSLRNWYGERQQTPVPTAVEYKEIVIKNDSDDSIKNKNVDAANTSEIIDPESSEDNKNDSPIIIPPAELNLAVPFTSQAPHANWELPYQEACEEASVLMAARFLQGRAIADANDADQAILELVDYNSTTLQQPIDTTAEQTATLLEAFYKLETEVVVDWNWDDVKQALVQGYPVIFPAVGRELGNPYFTAPGPLYHMLVIKGYTASSVITNDPGTRRGADYQYSYETLYNANHDWNGGDVTNGQRVIIIVKPAAV